MSASSCVYLCVWHYVSEYAVDTNILLWPAIFVFISLKTNFHSSMQSVKFCTLPLSTINFGNKDILCSLTVRMFGSVYVCMFVRACVVFCACVHKGTVYKLVSMHLLVCASVVFSGYAESMRASSLEVWMDYLKNVTLAVNGQMEKWRRKPAVSTRLVHVAEGGHELEHYCTYSVCTVV